MVLCHFCGHSLEPGTGKMYVFASGRIYYFCSMKCQKHVLKLGRKPLRTAWTNLAHETKVKAKHQKP